MIQWTTPTLECSIPEGLEFDYVLLTLVQGAFKIEKRVSAIEVIDNKFSVFYTQEETSSFELYSPIEAQINIMRGAVRVATNIVKMTIDRNLHKEFIEPDLPISLDITENGIYGVSQYLEVNVEVAGVQPTGTIDISENGTYDVADYAEAEVNIDIPTPTGTLEISQNGDYDVSDYAQASVQVPLPSGDINIDDNGTYNVAQYSSAIVNVPKGITPTGTQNITSNGVYDITDKASVDVQVPQGITPSGTQNITQNGIYDITDKANVDVQVPQPSGKIEITQNGTDIDVSQYEFADVSVQSQASSEVLWTSEVGEEGGEIPYLPDDLPLMFDEIRFVGARGQSTNLALGLYLSSRIRSASSSGNNLPLTYITTIGGVRTIQTIMVVFGSSINSTTFDVQSHFNIVNPASSDVSVVYEPTNKVKLYQIVGYKY